MHHRHNNGDNYHPIIHRWNCVNAQCQKSVYKTYHHILMGFSINFDLGSLDLGFFVRWHRLSWSNILVQITPPSNLSNQPSQFKCCTSLVRTKFLFRQSCDKQAEVERIYWDNRTLDSIAVSACVVNCGWLWQIQNMRQAGSSTGPLTRPLLPRSVRA